MGFFDDFKTAIDDYADESVDITVVDFEEPQDHIDQDEICTFRVRVSNRGQLDLRSVRLHISGFPLFTTVGSDGASFSTDFVDAGRQDIDSQTDATFPQQGDGTFHMRADNRTPSNVNVWPLVSIHISSFDVSLDHLLTDHTRHAAGPSAVYVRHIHPGPQ